MSLVIKNGRVIDPSSNTDRVADVLIVDGRIAGVAPNLSSPKAEVFDATAPYTPRGCIAQAWSVAETLRCWVKTAPETTG